MPIPPARRFASVVVLLVLLTVLVVTAGVTLGAAFTGGA